MIGFGSVSVLVTHVMTTVIGGVDIAERFIRGEGNNGRGAEKRQVVIDNTASSLETMLNDPQAQQIAPPQLLSALAHSLAAPDFRESIGKLVDATVEVANYLKDSQNVESARPKLVQ